MQELICIFIAEIEEMRSLTEESQPAPTFSVSLHPAGGVDGVAKQAVAGHLESHHGGTAGPGVDTDPELETFPGHVADLETPDGLQQLEGHPGHLHGMSVGVPHWQSCRERR